MYANIITQAQMAFCSANNFLFALDASTTDQLTTFFTNLKTKIESWGGGLIMVIGAAMLVMACIQIFQAFTSRGRGQANWLTIGCLILIGGAFFAGGFNLMKNLSNVGNDALINLSTETAGTTETTPAP